MSANLVINGNTYNNVSTITLKNTNNDNIIFELPTESSLVDSILDGTISGQYINSEVSKIVEYTFWCCYSLQSVYLPLCQSISNNAFRFCSLLQSVYIPNCQTISGYAFGSCYALSIINAPSCVTIGTHAFENCSILSSISFPACISIGEGAFTYCISLTQASFPLCQYVTGFGNCTALSSISFPECISIGSYAFRSCIFTQASFPKCTYISPYGPFYECQNLQTISIPLVSYIGISAFWNCEALSIISLPKCETIGIAAFQWCRSLSKVYCCWENNLIISNYAFSGCFNLLSLYLLGSNLAQLDNTSAFYTTPISNYTTSTGGVYGSIFVPASLYDSYKTATNWLTYSARFASLTDAQVSQIKSQMGIVD